MLSRVLVALGSSFSVFVSHFSLGPLLVETFLGHSLGTVTPTRRPSQGPFWSFNACERCTHNKKYWLMFWHKQTLVKDYMFQAARLVMHVSLFLFFKSLFVQKHHGNQYIHGPCSSEAPVFERLGTIVVLSF